MFFWLQKFPNLAFLSSTSLSMFFLSFQKVRLEDTNFVSGDNLFYRYNSSFDIIQHIFPLRQIIGLSIHNKGKACSGIALPTSSKMVSAVLPRFFFIITRLSFDSPFSFMTFNKSHKLL